eukprot:758562-Hanusia_phi.AAC.1
MASQVDTCVDLFRRLLEAVDGHARGVKELQARESEQLQAQKILSLQAGLEEQAKKQIRMEEEVSSLHRQLFNAQRAYDVETARLKLEKMAMEKKLQSQLQVVERYVRKELEQESVRQKLQQHLALLPEELAERFLLLHLPPSLSLPQLPSSPGGDKVAGKTWRRSSRNCTLVVSCLGRSTRSMKRWWMRWRRTSSKVLLLLSAHMLLLFSRSSGSNISSLTRASEIELLTITNTELILDLHRIRGENISVSLACRPSPCFRLLPPLPSLFPFRLRFLHILQQVTATASDLQHHVDELREELEKQTRKLAAAEQEVVPSFSCFSSLLCSLSLRLLVVVLLPFIPWLFL